MLISKINVIGCGRLGKTLASLFIKHNMHICGVVNASYDHALEAVKWIGGGKACQHIHELPPADAYFITTPDDVIQSACDELVRGDVLRHGAIVVHCSGSLTSDVLSQAKQKNCHIASVHPVKSFASPEDSVRTFSDTYCGMEGDAIALSRLKVLFEQIGGRVFQINKEQKDVYHAAGVLANNYLVSLHYQAVQAYKISGMDDETAKLLATQLMQDAISNLKNFPHHEALTGPIQRGDVQTINKHLCAFKNHPAIRDVYTALGRATVSLTKHAEDKKNELMNILELFL